MAAAEVGGAEGAEVVDDAAWHRFERSLVLHSLYDILGSDVNCSKASQAAQDSLCTAQIAKLLPDRRVTLAVAAGPGTAMASHKRQVVALAMTPFRFDVLLWSWLSVALRLLGDSDRAGSCLGLSDRFKQPACAENAARKPRVRRRIRT